MAPRRAQRPRYASFSTVRVHIDLCTPTLALILWASGFVVQPRTLDAKAAVQDFDRHDATTRSISGKWPYSRDGFRTRRTKHSRKQTAQNTERGKQIDRLLCWVWLGKTSGEETEVYQAGQTTNDVTRNNYLCLVSEHFIRPSHALATESSRNTLQKLAAQAEAHNQVLTINLDKQDNKRRK